MHPSQTLAATRRPTWGIGIAAAVPALAVAVALSVAPVGTQSGSASSPSTPAAKPASAQAVTAASATAPATVSPALERIARSTPSERVVVTVRVRGGVPIRQAISALLSAGAEIPANGVKVGSVSARMQAAAAQAMTSRPEIRSVGLAA